MNLHAGRGVAVREYPLQTGYADYLLFVERKAAGVLEAKAEGIPLAGVAEQAGVYAAGLQANVPRPAYRPAAALPVREHRGGDLLPR